MQFWHDRPDIRKPLSHYGAVSIERSNFLQVLQSAESLNCYYIWITKQANFESEGYVYLMYHDYGNAIMSNWFNTLNLSHGTLLNKEHKGDLTEAALHWAGSRCRAITSRARRSPSCRPWWIT